MSSDFADRLRSAAGVPTSAERDAERKKRAEAAEAWQQGAPQRQAYLSEFRNKVMPLINSAFAIAESVAQEARTVLTVTDHQSFFPATENRPQILWQQDYVLGPPPGNAFMPHSSIGKLEIILTSDGLVTINIENTGEVLQSYNIFAKPPQKKFSPGMPISSITAENIEKEFANLLSYLRR